MKTPQEWIDHFAGAPGFRMARVMPRDVAAIQQDAIAEMEAQVAEANRIQSESNAVIARSANDWNMQRKLIAELEAQVAELYDLLDDVQPQNTEDCAYNSEWDRRRIAVLARTAPREQCRVDVGGYPCEEPRPCDEHDRTAPKDPQP